MLIDRLNMLANAGVCALVIAALPAIGSAAPGATSAADPAGGRNLTGYFQIRGDFVNTRLRVASGETVRVAYLGGSITEHGQWPGLVSKGLAERFPKAQLDFLNAGISSYDSTSDAFRFGRDVTSKGRVDLLFIDCAVNDLHNQRSQTERIRAMEGIIRKARAHNPFMDVIVLHFADLPHVMDYAAGKTPPIIASHEKVASHYGASTIDMAHRVSDDIAAKRYEWKKFGGAHPSPFGNELYAAMIASFFDTVWAKPLPAGAKLTKRPMPAEPLDKLNYENARLLKLQDAKIVSGWKIQPGPGVPTRPRHKNAPFMVATEPGAELSLKFTGRAVGILGVFGPDCGMIDYRIDEGPWKTRDPFTRWSRRLHLGWTYVLEAELPAGEHVLTLRTSQKKNPASKGSACRIRRFIAN